MKLNTLINKILSLKYMAVALVAASAMSSCDNISADDRFIELPKVEAKRVVLLEEFTGQLCVNCPEAHTLITELLGQYPDNLIAISIHGGGDAFSWSEDMPGVIGLRNADGQAYCDGYNIYSLPSAVVNRRTGALSTAQWASSIREELDRPSDIDMQLSVDLSDDGKTITAYTSVLPHQNIQGNLQLWVVESNITAPQLTPQGFNMQYVHNHIFRACANGHDGDPVSLTTRVEANYEHTIAVSDKWNAKNLAVVAFVYNKDGVLQAVEAEVE